MSGNLINFVLRVNLCILIALKTSSAFNLDPKNAVVYRGPNGSYFGYSVGILENKEGKFILVGAPTDNNTAILNITRPGQLYKCSYESKHTCQPVLVTNAGNIEETVTYNKKRIFFHNDMTNQWLGMSMDIEPTTHSHVVVCSPRWKDSFLVKKMNGMSHMTGICYLLSADLSSSPTTIPALSNLKRLVNRDNYYVEFSMGQMGFSAVFAKDNGTILFGAPGLNDWTGGTVVETITGEEDVQYIEPSINKYKNSYAGYSLTTGRFMSSDRYSIAIGAPRADNIGKVLLYSIKSKFGPLLTVPGTQVGSYFGASVASVAIIKEQLDYLVVGAPMSKGACPEEGRVYVFKSHGLLGFKRVAEIRGLGKPYGRFGLSVANAGDLNKDEFEDIIIGAPYEDGDVGAVYIFNGYRQGVWPMYTARIIGKDVDNHLKGFGISFSRPYDIDKNEYPDIAVGAHRSDNAIVLLSTPLVDMSTSSLEIQNLQEVPGCIVKGRLSANCSSHKLLKGRVVFCLVYNSQNVEFPSSIVVKYHLKFDSKRNFSRVYHYNKDRTLTTTQVMSGKRKLRMNKSTCDNETVYIQYTDEYTEEVMVNLDYNIRGRKVMLQTFDGKKNPPEILHQREAKISLASECDDCLSNFEIDANLSIQPGNTDVFIRGESEKILVTLNIVNITKTNTPSDISMLIKHSNSISFIKCVNTFNSESLPCDIVKGNTSVIMCMADRVSLTEQLEIFSASFEFYLFGESSSVDLSSSVDFDVSVVSGKRVSNNVTMMMPVISASNISVIGRPSKEEIFFRLDKANDTENLQRKIAYSYMIYNSGPSTLKTSSILISYPEIPTIIDMNGLNIESTSKDFSEYLCTLKKRGELDSTLNKRINGRQKLQLICTGGHPYCTIIMCKLNNIHARVSVTLTINMLMSIKEKKLQRLSSVRLGSTGIFRNTSDEEHWDQIVLFSSSTDRTEVIIDVYNIDLKNNIKELRIWIIIVSGAAGIAVYLIISLLMLKVGFFRRLDNEDLQLRKANWKLRLAETRRHHNGTANGNVSSSHQAMRHNANNPCFSNEIDIDETHVLICYSNASPSNSIEEISSISSDISDESGYLEPIRTRKQRVFVK